MIDLDFENGRFWFGGEEKALEDLTAHSTGYFITDLTGINPADGYTVMVEWITPQGQSAAETLMALGNTANAAYRMDISLSSGNKGQPVLTLAAPSSTTGFFTPDFALPHDTDTAPMMGRRRVMFSIDPGAVPIGAADGYPVERNGATLAGTPTFNKLAVGFRTLGSTNDQFATNNPLRVVVWSGAKSISEIERIMAGRRPGRIGALIDYPAPVHFLADSFGNGDSYANGGGLIDSIRSLCTDRYVMISDDVAGGTSLTQQAVRFAAYPRYWDSTLVPLEIGMDGSGEAYCDALDDMIGRLTHDRWLVIEPSYDPRFRVGTPERTQRDTDIAAINAHLSSLGKADRWVATKAGMQALAREGNATDEQDVADDIWPSDDTYWTTDELHQRKVGRDGLAAIIVAALQAKGWI